MRESYGVMPNTFAPVARKVYFIVEHVTTNPGNGESHTLYLSLPGEWSEDEKDALRYPQRVLAEAHANRFKGTVRECKP